MPISKISDPKIHIRWKNRLKALDEIFALEEERLKRLNSIQPVVESSMVPFVRSNTLAQLLKRLRCFSEGQYDFFYNGFFAQYAHSLSEPKEVKNRRYKKFKGLPTLYAHDAVLNTILSKISHDLDVLARTNDQRFASGKVAERLVKADILTIGALLAMGDAFGLPEEKSNSEIATVVTYFSSSTSIRVIPYAPVALLSISMTAMQEDYDFLAIPHEIGHLLYWKGRFKHKADGKLTEDFIRHRISVITDKKWIYEWEEEIFADVVGCLIGGPAMVPGLRDLMKTQVGSEFIHNDGDHPVPAIRPYILTHVLKQYLGEEVIANNADTEWGNILKVRGHASLDQEVEVEVYEQSELVTNRCKLVDLKHILKDMVDAIVKSVLLPNGMKLRAPDDELRWSKNRTTFELTEEFIKTILSRVHEKRIWDPNFEGYPPNEPLPDDFWEKKLSEVVINRLPQKPKWWNDKTQTIKKFPAIPADDWIAILEFGGWTSEGPGPGNAH